MPTIEEFLALPAEEQDEKITRLLHETIHEGPPEVKETAYAMGLSPFTLYKWGSSESEKQPRPRQLIHLMHLKNNLRILEWLAALFGGVFFRLPAGSGTLPEIHRETGRAVKEFGELLQEVAGAMEDGRITPAEVDRVEREGREAIGQIARLLEAFRKITPGVMKMRTGEGFTK